jgi:hypothetical protein
MHHCYSDVPRPGLLVLPCARWSNTYRGCMAHISPTDSCRQTLDRNFFFLAFLVNRLSWLNSATQNYWDCIFLFMGKTIFSHFLILPNKGGFVGEVLTGEDKWGDMHLGLQHHSAIKVQYHLDVTGCNLLSDVAIIIRYFHGS